MGGIPWVLKRGCLKPPSPSQDPPEDLEPQATDEATTKSRLLRRRLLLLVQYQVRVLVLVEESNCQCYGSRSLALQGIGQYLGPCSNYLLRFRETPTPKGSKLISKPPTPLAI